MPERDTRMWEMPVQYSELFGELRLIVTYKVLISAKQARANYKDLHTLILAPAAEIDRR